MGYANGSTGRTPRGPSVFWHALLTTCARISGRMAYTSPHARC